MKKVSLVVGMHRSGTSAVAGCLFRLGLFDIGRSVMPPSFDNPKGFYENLEVVRFNDSLLAHFGVEWSDSILIHHRIELMDDFECFAGRLDQIFSSEFVGDTILIKDPRLAILYPFWEKYLTTRKYDFKILEFVRSPDSVANSLVKRNGFSEKKGFGLWFHYMYVFHQSTKSSNRLLCSFDYFFDNPIRSTSIICEYLLSIALDESFIGEKISEFVERKNVSVEAEQFFDSDSQLVNVCRRYWKDVVLTSVEQGSEVDHFFDELTVKYFQQIRESLYPFLDNQIRVLVVGERGNRQYRYQLNPGENELILNSEHLEGVNVVRVYPSNSFAEFTIESIDIDSVDNSIAPKLGFDRIYRFGEKCFSVYGGASFDLDLSECGCRNIRILLNYFSADISAIREFTTSLLSKIEMMQNEVSQLGLPKASVEDFKINEIKSICSSLLDKFDQGMIENQNSDFYLSQEYAEINDEIKQGINMISNRVDSFYEKFSVSTEATGDHIQSISSRLEAICQRVEGLDTQLKRDINLLRDEQNQGEVAVSRLKDYCMSQFEDIRGELVVGRSDIVAKVASINQSSFREFNSFINSKFESFQATHELNSKSLKDHEVSIQGIVQLMHETQKKEEERDRREEERDKCLSSLRSDLKDREWELEISRSDIHALRQSWTWRIGRCFISPVYWLITPFRVALKHRLLTDLYLARDLLKREGIREFLRRFFWYLQGKRLIEEIPLRQSTKAISTSDISFSKYSKPEFSIIIPVYNEWKYTEICLRSIFTFTGPNVSFEVIVANDCSTDETEKQSTKIAGLKHIKPPENLGFLRNCNYAASRARGRYLYFLNNDTQVKDGWLESIKLTFEEDARVAVVGSKLIFPNGRLQEAGGIIFNDASGWNFGRGQDPEAPEYNYLRETDYCSGAALSIRRDVWKELGGFDERFAPAYYEDTDLCFAVRKLGYRTVYQPRSEVVHYEGVSHGTDVDAGIKSYQIRNQKRFLDKWKDVLADEHSSNGEDIFRVREKSLRRKIVLFIDHYVPFYDKDAGSRSTFQWIQVFQDLGYSVKFIGDNFFRHEPYTTVLQNKGVEVLYGNYYHNNWKKWIKENSKDFDFVYFHRPHITLKYLDFVKENTTAKTLYQPHDLHFLRLRRKWELDKDEDSLKQSQNWFEKEKYIAETVDVCLTFSDYELNVLKKDFNCNATSTVPLFVYDDFLIPKITNRGRSGLLFVGGFGHPPNIDALNWFLDNVFPGIVETFPDIVLHLVGSNMPDELKARSGNNIKTYGYVTDDELEGIYKSVKVVIIPLRYGAGVKGKLIEAMKHGVPVVGTSVAIEGVPGIENVIPSTDTVEDFQGRIVELLKDNRRWLDCANMSVEFISSNFTKTAASKVMEQIINDIS